MGKKFKIVTGSEVFREVIEQYDVYVDKSLFIQEVIDSSEKAILITRPRRWGKTLNLDMLKTFFEPESEKCKNIGEKCNRDLFTDLKINGATDYRDEDIMDKYQGKYPVISFTLKNVKADSLEEVEKLLRELVTSIYRQHKYLLKNLNIDEDEKLQFQEYLNNTYKKVTLTNSIKFLSDLLKKHHDEKVYILIDEYDKPVNHLLEENPQKQDEELIKSVADLVSGILASCGKSNASLEKIILTGILDTVKKEGNSGFNSVSVFDIQNPRFSKSFGFLEEEINGMLSILGFKEEETLQARSNIASWYNGYIVPMHKAEDARLYTPWAVMKYLNSAYYDGNFTPKNYWTQSGTNTMLSNILETSFGNKDLKEKLSNIDMDSEIELLYIEELSLMTDEFEPEAMVSYLLLNSGYLTVRIDGNKYFFRIPNQEVTKTFIRVIETKVYYLKEDGSAEATEKLEYFIPMLVKFKSNYDVIDIMGAIANKDNEVLTQLFEANDDLKCSYNRLNFNFFHIGAASGNKKVFTNLLNQCDSELLNKSDKEGLKIVDYAHLFHGDEIEPLLGEQYQPLGIPNFLVSIYCHDWFFLPLLTVSTSLIRTSIKYAGKFKPVTEFLEKYGLGTFGVMFAIDFALVNSKNIKKIIDNNICDYYDGYHKIKADSLLGYKKYIDANGGIEKNYIAVGECEENDKELKFFDMQVSSIADELVLKFSLCEVNIHDEL